MTLLGVAADAERTLSRFRQRMGLRCTLLSDPELQVAERLGVPVSRHHPKSKRYPRGAFLQPGFFVVDRHERLRDRWVQEPGLLNGYGAAGRPSGEEMLARARRVLADDVPGG